MPPDVRPKPVVWVGPSLSDLRTFPGEVQRLFGYALEIAQYGGKHRDAKPLKGFKGAGILEVVEDHDGDTFRAVYTVKLAGRIYVLHAFQKKARKGIKTLKHHLDLIRARLRQVEQIQQELEEQP